jgi:hypothetical protein
MWLEAKRADYEERQPSRNTKQRERRRLKEADETRRRREAIEKQELRRQAAQAGLSLY